MTIDIHKSADTKLFQESEYFLPYHWLVERASKKGAVYFGYWEMALRLAGNLSGKDVLDAGSGDGFFTSLVARKNPRSVVGADYSARAVLFAKLLVADAEFHVEDLSRLTFPNQSFDIVFLIEVLEHVPYSAQENLLKELLRVLRDDGILIVSSPSVLMPVIEKHEQHFSESTFRDALAPFFTAAKIVGQDRAGYLRSVYLFMFRFAKNRFWTIHPLVRFLSVVFYPRFLNEAPLSRARRYVGIFKKSSR